MDVDRNPGAVDRGLADPGETRGDAAVDGVDPASRLSDADDDASGPADDVVRRAAARLASARGLAATGASEAALSVGLDAAQQLLADYRQLAAETARLAGQLRRRTQEAEARYEDAIRESNRHLRDALTELRTTQQQVIQQERLRALGQMASGIAHDFNNALAHILGYIELLLTVRSNDLYDPPKVRRYLTLMGTAAEDAADVVRRLREFYRFRSAGDVFVPVDLNRLIEQAVSLTRPRWRDQALAGGTEIAVETDLEAVPAVLANETELREVLTNLIFNAVEAMPDGGTIVVRTRAQPGAVVLEVEDTGIGMDEEVRGRCLEPFFTTKGQRGSGLGLAMVHGIVRRHEGSIEVVSAPGRGTRFAVRLPLREANGPPPAGERTDDDEPSPRRILVVDDEPELGRITREYLEAWGHAVETARDGREALRRFLAGRFDLVITDRAMPEMNGDRLAAALKQLAPEVPVVLLTGFGDIMLAGGERPPGVDAILTKPLGADALRRAIREVFRRVMP